MKVLVFAHHLEVGNTQTNAIELATALRDQHGFEIVLFATPGPMVSRARENGLRYVPAPDAFIHPSPSRIAALEKVIRRERPDVIHVWDWWQCVDAFYIAHLLRRIPLLVTDMMMNLNTVLPRSVPATFGTPEIADQARAAGWKRAELLLPPVDTQQNTEVFIQADIGRVQLQKLPAVVERSPLATPRPLPRYRNFAPRRPMRGKGRITSRFPSG